MKKIITLTICLALICSSIVPSYAASNAVYEFMDSMNGSGGRIGAYTAMQTIISYLTLISNQGISTQNFLTLDGDGNTPSTYYSFQDAAADLRQIAIELNFSGITMPNAFTVKELLEMIESSLINTESYTQNTYSAILTQNTSLLPTQFGQVKAAINNLNNYNFQKYPAFNYYFYNRDIRTSHWQIDEQGNFGDYTQEYLQYNSSQNNSILDYIVAFLSDINYNQAVQYNQLMTDVDSQLSIWDSQGNTLSQSTWTPTSGFNGLYKYLAFTQRDVARLTHVYASDEEIAARDAARQNQTSVVNNFVDSNGMGSISQSNLGDMASVSGSLKSNFDTGASVSGVFAFFSNGSSTNWFSQATKDALDTNQTRSNSSNTPLLNAYYEEIYDLLGIGDDNR